MNDAQRAAGSHVDTLAVSLVASTAMAFNAVLTPMNAVLAFSMIVLVALDVVVGTATAYLESKPGEDWFSWDTLRRGAVKKLILICLIGVAIAVDAAFSAAFGDIFSKLTPATKYALSHAIIAQVVSIAKNARIVKELRPLAAFLLRRMDAANLGEEPPVRRSGYDFEAVRVEEQMTTKDGRKFSDAAIAADKAQEGE